MYRLSAGLWLILAVSGFAQDESAKPAKVRSVEGITEYRLANGLQVLEFLKTQK